jgi:hypothetical protein
MEERIAKLESLLKLDERLDKIEKKFRPTGSRGWIVAVVLILSAILPIMQWIQGTLKTERELKIAESVQTLSTQKDWLNMAVRQDLSPQEKQRVLRFLKYIASEEGIKKWAEMELTTVDAEVEKLEVQLAAAEAEKKQAYARIERLQKEREAAISVGGQRVKELSLELESAKKARLSAELEGRRLSEMLTKTPQQSLVTEVFPLMHESHLVGIFGADRFARCHTTFRGWGWEGTGDTPEQVCGNLLRGRKTSTSRGEYRIRGLAWDNGLYISLLLNGEITKSGCSCRLD